MITLLQQNESIVSCLLSAKVANNPVRKRGKYTILGKKSRLPANLNKFSRTATKFPDFSRKQKFPYFSLNFQVFPVTNNPVFKLKCLNFSQRTLRHLKCLKFCCICVWILGTLYVWKIKTPFGVWIIYTLFQTLFFDWNQAVKLSLHFGQIAHPWSQALSIALLSI